MSKAPRMAVMVLCVMLVTGCHKASRFVALPDLRRSVGGMNESSLVLIFY